MIRPTSRSVNFDWIGFFACCGASG
jgi:hypothetical protein